MKFSLFLSACLVFSFHSIKAQSSSEKILELLNIIQFAYVDTFNSEQLNEAAIVSVLAELDPHSVYIPKKQVDEMNESLRGSFEGIGVQFDIYNDTVLVVSPISGGPSEKLGIRSGDKIIRTGDIVISGIGISDEEVISLLRGKKGSQIGITIRRNGVKNEIDYLITRDKIPIHSVDAGFMLDEKTGYVKINRFSKTTLDEFKTSMKALNKAGMENLVLDLRGNGGGYLYSAVELADEFLDGKEVIVSTKGMRQSDQVYKAKPKGDFTKGKLIVLIDEGSASASEILAGAIQDWDRGLLIGRRSFGKGLVMKPFTFSDGSMVRLTTSRYYTPSGRCIQKDYSESKESYEEEIHHRYEKGEFFSMDSVQVPKDLRFLTSKGRVVYGGGGILPDVFFPADTLVFGNRYQNILKSGSILEFTLWYFDKHRDQLVSKYETARELSSDPTFSNDLIESYKTFVLDNNIEVKVESDIYKPLSTQLIAFIARHIWGEPAYYETISINQSIINHALSIINTDNGNWDNLSQRNK